MSATHRGSTTSCQTHSGRAEAVVSLGAEVEVVGVDLDRAGTLWYRAVRRAVVRPECPVAVARLVAGIASDQEGLVLHSTSWRHTGDGTVVLTFLACPDPRAAALGEALPDLAVARGTGSSSPVPADLQTRHVVAHAIGHLAFLVGTDPSVSRGRWGRPRLHEALARVQPAVAGALTAGSPVSPLGCP